VRDRQPVHLGIGRERHCDQHAERRHEERRKQRRQRQDKF
jgi:hypothetical protein